MSFGKAFTIRGLALWAAVFCTAMMITSPARAGFHVWSLQELYSDSSGTLQFIELIDLSGGGQQFVGGTTLSVSNVGNTITHMITFPNSLPSDSANHTFLIGTAGIQAAGGPAPDFIVLPGFLFPAGGSISYFNASGPYTALPTDGTMSYNWAGGFNAVNSPQNFAFETGTVTVPEPTAMLLSPLAAGMYGAYRWLRRRTGTSPVIESSEQS